MEDEILDEAISNLELHPYIVIRSTGVKDSPQVRYECEVNARDQLHAINQAIENDKEMVWKKVKTGDPSPFTYRHYSAELKP